MNSRHLAATIAILTLPLVLGADWTRFRGPNGSGVSDSKELPTSWDSDKNMAWKTKLPGPGTSSPIVFGDKVFVTAYSGYGVKGERGDIAQLKRHVICLELKSGKVLWDTAFPAKGEEFPYSGIGIPNHGYASSTPVTDGKHVYAFLGMSGVVALDMAGKKIWEAQVSDNPSGHNFGSASSPLLYKNLVIVPASVETEAIIAYDKASGKEVWRAKATGYGAWWSTPILVKVGDQQELVINVPDEMWGLNPDTGKLRWYCETFNSRNVNSSVIAHEGIVYALGRGNAIAVKAGGKNDVTQTNVVWRKNVGSDIPSPIFKDGYLYWVTDRGQAICVDAKNGDTVYQERLEGARQVYASVVLGGDKLFAVTRDGGTNVLSASKEFKPIARNTFEGDRGDFNATPAIVDGRILIRSDSNLYCIGKK